MDHLSYIRFVFSFPFKCLLIFDYFILFIFVHKMVRWHKTSKYILLVYLPSVVIFNFLSLLTAPAADEERA